MRRASSWVTASEIPAGMVPMPTRAWMCMSHGAPARAMFVRTAPAWHPVQYLP